MNKPEKRALAQLPDSAPSWTRGYFMAEAVAEAAAEAHERPRAPRSRPTLKAGDRVEFDLGEGVDGPPYATNVRPGRPG